VPSPVRTTAASPARTGQAVVPPARSARPSPRARLHTEALFDGTNEIEIQHGEVIYRLRITSLGKLILTK
jgi:hemin uptake protein HemP